MAEINYSELTEEQLQIINDYCKNDMKKLKKVCYMVWGKKGLPYMYHDDLYDDAMNVLLESVISFKSDKKTKFQTYLLGNVKRSYHDWFRDNRLRAKRSNLELDENGRIKKDENGNPIIKRIPKLMIMSFETIEEGIDENEKVRTYNNESTNSETIDTFSTFNNSYGDDLPF